ncbi:hypothetical protein EDB89DRAFT_1919100 [Lactarius sanguifluus]|nr:hypothetical protein EDB89DRAFT_1919100 [Lactarius sanguifluus]
MATCIPTPTLTLFTTVTSTTVITTFSTGVQTLPDTTSPIIFSLCLSTVSGTCVSSTVRTETTVIPGGVSTISGPLIITSIITEVNPISTIFASCSPSPSIPSSISPSSSSQIPSQTSSVSSFTPTTFLVTTTPSPIVVTEESSSTLNNGAVTVITVLSTSTPPPSVVALSTSIVATPSQSQGSKSSIALAPIVGGAVGGFSFLVIVVVAVWFLLRKCCGSSEGDDDDDIVFPYPVTRDRDHTQDLDLSHEPKPYVYGLVGGSTRGAAVMAPQSSPSDSRASDGRPDSATALIGPSSGFASMAMATGASAGGLLSSAPSAPSKGGEVGRQTSHGSIIQLPPGAAAPSTYLGSSSWSGPPPGPGRYPLQVVNPPSIRSSFPVEMVGSSNSSAKEPLVVSEGGGQSARAEKKSASGPSLPEGDVIVHTDGGRLPVPGHGLLASGSGSKTPAQPEVSSSDSPPAYVA